MLDDKDLRLAKALLDLCICLRKGGKIEAAQVRFKEAFEIFAHELGGFYPPIGKVIMRDFLCGSDTIYSEVQLRDALNILDGEVLVFSIQKIARRCVQEGKIEEAVTSYQDALDTCQLKCVNHRLIKNFLKKNDMEKAIVELYELTMEVYDRNRESNGWFIAEWNFDLGEDLFYENKYLQ